MKVCPVPSELLRGGKTNDEVMEQCLLHSDNSDNYSLTPKYGFKFRNLNTTKVYYDEVHRRLMSSYRQLFTRYAMYCIDTKKDTKKAVKILDEMNKIISVDAFPMFQDEEIQVAMLYRQAKAMDKAKQFANMALKTCNSIMNNKDLRDVIKWRVPSMLEEVTGMSPGGVYKTTAEAYSILEKFDDAKAALNQLFDICVQAMNSPDATQYKSYIQRNVYSVLGQIYSIDDEQINVLEEKGKKTEAIAKANQIIDGYKKTKDPRYSQLILMLEQRIEKLTGKTPVSLDSAKTDTAIAQ